MILKHIEKVEVGFSFILFYCKTPVPGLVCKTGFSYMKGFLLMLCLRELHGNKAFAISAKSDLNLTHGTTKQLITE